MATPKPAPAKLKSPLVLLLIAAVMAGAVSWAAYYYLQQKEASMKAEIVAKGRANVVERVEVAVPIADVPVGTVLNQNTFVARKVEADLVYPDTVLAANFPSLEGSKLARPVLRGRPLRLTDLVMPEVKDVSSILPPGRRAMTIDIDNVNSIAQTLRPNNRIDLFLMTKAKSAGAGGEEAEQEQATLYMQNMVVLATGNEFFDVNGAPAGAAEKMVRPGDVPGKESQYDSVTLLVTPLEAARLMVGQKMGAYRIVLRGARDTDRIAMPTMRSSDFLPSAMKGRDNGVEFIVGGKGDKLVTQMPTSPSQEMAARAAQQQASAAALRALSSPPLADNSNRNVTVTMPAPRAARPISSVQ